MSLESYSLACTQQSHMTYDIFSNIPYFYEFFIPKYNALISILHLTLPYEYCKDLAATKAWVFVGYPWHRPHHVKLVLTLYLNFDGTNPLSQQFPGRRYVLLCLRNLLDLHIACAISEGFGETTHLCRLAGTFSVHIYVKQTFYMLRHIWNVKQNLFSVIDGECPEDGARVQPVVETMEYNISSMSAKAWNVKILFFAHS